MFIFIHPWLFRGAPVFTAFSHGYARRKNGRTFRLTPSGGCRMEDLTAEEIGQLLGGN